MTRLLDPHSGNFASDGTPAEPGPPIPCRVLLLEDNGMDADLVREHLLMIDDHDFDIQRVDARQPFIDAVAAGGPYDLILSDFDLPDFDGMSALAIARERLPRVPFIFVSGMLGEENAIEALKKGATDYVVKLRMERLQVVVRRALVEARDRNELADKRQALAESEARLRFALEAGRLGSWELTLADNRLHVSSICAANLGLSDPDELSSYDRLLAHVHPEDRGYQQAMVQQALSSGSPLDMEYRTVWPDGSVHWVQVRGRAVYDRDGAPTALAGVSLNITDRKKAEERQLLLLEELNHRVKNTLQMASSFLRIQMSIAQSQEPAVQEALHSAVERLDRMTEIHEKLYRAQGLQEIEFGGYLGMLCRDLLASFGAAHGLRVVLDIDADEAFLKPDQAIPLALIANEAMINALKYAFPDGRSGRVAVSFRHTSRSLLCMTIGDDGVGMPDERRAGSLGLTLMELLAEQIEASVTVRSDKGTTVTVSIPA